MQLMPIRKAPEKHRERYQEVLKLSQGPTTIGTSSLAAYSPNKYQKEPMMTPPSIPRLLEGNFRKQMKPAIIKTRVKVLGLASSIGRITK